VIACVTGANGHLGNNVVRALLERGQAVRALVFGDARSLAELDVEQITADVRDGEAMRRAIAGVDVVYHAAGVISTNGSRDGLVEAVNVAGTRHVVDAALAAGVKKLVHVSSFRVYRNGAAPLHEARARVLEAAPSAYDRSKAAAEREVLRGVRAGLDAVIVNPTGILGPHDYEPSRMGRVLRDLAAGRYPALTAGGCNWVDARDVARAMIAAAERGRTGHNYLIAGEWASMRELAEITRGVTGHALPKLTIPMALLRAAAPAVTLASKWLSVEPPFTHESLASLREHKVISFAKAAAELGHRPRALRETVHAVLDWFGVAAA
jgi:dihydroflavonol-4-reductase